MSVYNINAGKSVKSGAAFAQWEPVKISTEDTENEGLVVVKTAATTDVVIGVAIDDATASGQGVDIALAGSVVLMRSGGVITLGDYVGLSGTDKTEIATLSLSAGGGTLRQVLGVALQTAAENELIPVLFSPFVYEV